MFWGRCHKNESFKHGHTFWMGMVSFISPKMWMSTLVFLELEYCLWTQRWKEIFWSAYFCLYVLSEGHSVWKDSENIGVCALPAYFDVALIVVTMFPLVGSAVQTYRVEEKSYTAFVLMVQGQTRRAASLTNDPHLHALFSSGKKSVHSPGPQFKCRWANLRQLF